MFSEVPGPYYRRFFFVMAFKGLHVRSLMQRRFVSELEKVANVIPKTKNIPDISLSKFINI